MRESSRVASQTTDMLNNLNFKLSPWNEYWFLVLGFLHGVRGEFTDDVSGAAVGPETSLGNLPRTPYKNPKTKNQKYFCLSVQENYTAHRWLLRFEGSTTVVVHIVMYSLVGWYQCFGETCARDCSCGSFAEHFCLYLCATKCHTPMLFHTKQSRMGDLSCGYNGIVGWWNGTGHVARARRREMRTEFLNLNWKRPLGRPRHIQRSICWNNLLNNERVNLWSGFCLLEETVPGWAVLKKVMNLRVL